MYEASGFQPCLRLDQPVRPQTAAVSLADSTKITGVVRDAPAKCRP